MASLKPPRLSISNACDRQTISGQVKLLDEVLGGPLFQRAGRGLVLTHPERKVKHPALADIFERARQQLFADA